MSGSELKLKEFSNITYKVTRKDRSKNTLTLQRYRTEIIEGYNNFLQYVNSVYQLATSGQKGTLDSRLTHAKQLVEQCFDILKCEYTWPNDFYEPIDIELVGNLPNIPELSVINENPRGEHSNEKNTISTEQNKPDGNPQSEPKREENTKFEMNSLELFNVVNRQFRQNYSGEPLGLTTFIDAVEILETFATTADLRKDLLRYLTAKLEGRAREYITDTIVSIEQFKRVLRDNIQPENSKVIEGRIASLRYAYSKQGEFSAKAEELADALRRTLIIEGMTPKKANEISVDKTIELCRKSTNSDLVKSVLASSSFKSPKEVIAKLITESDATIKEQKVLKYNQFTHNAQRGNSRGNGRGNYFNRGRGNRGYHYGDVQNNGNSRGNYQRGRGYGRGNNRYHNNNGRYNGNGYNNQNQNNSGPNIRVAQAGNGQGPQEIHMGGTGNQ